MKEDRVVLADRPGLGKIFCCGCGAIHVNVGPVTINLEPQTFAQLTALMNIALEHRAYQDRAQANKDVAAMPHQGDDALYLN